jgi:hypothetical protein
MIYLITKARSEPPARSRDYPRGGADLERAAFVKVLPPAAAGDKEAQIETVLGRRIDFDPLFHGAPLRKSHCPCIVPGMGVIRQRESARTRTAVG